MGNNRSTYLINPKFQLRTGLFVCSLTFIASLPYPFLIYGVVDDMMNRLAVGAVTKNNLDLVTTFEKLRSDLIVDLAIWQVGFIAFVFIICIFQSHKIAGPLYKLRDFLQKIREGNGVGKLFFRKGDHFTELADDFNETFQKIQNTYNDNLTYLSEVKSYINNISSVVPEDKQIVLTEISAKLTEIQERFKSN